MDGFDINWMRDGEQSDSLADYVEPLWDEITLNEKGEYTDGDLNIIFIEDRNYFNLANDELNYSFAFFGLAVVVVELYLSFHLHSCFLGCGAMLQILLSFVLGFFWYRIIFWIDYTDYFTVNLFYVFLDLKHRGSELYYRCLGD